MTRGELTSRIDLRITGGAREMLDTIARGREVKVSVVVREFIDEKLKEWEDENDHNETC